MRPDNEDDGDAKECVDVQGSCSTLDGGDDGSAKAQGDEMRIWSVLNLQTPSLHPLRQRLEYARYQQKVAIL